MKLLRHVAAITSLSFFACLLGMAPPAITAQKVAEYQNPILFSDYSDPDVIRDGKNFYLISSTFQFVPGIPILQSQDLVHWTIRTHVLPRISFSPQYDLVDGNRYGQGVWAPALRKHKGSYYVYFPTPDEGIFVSTAKNISGPWSLASAVLAEPGLEDPCPFWDDDDKAYLIHSRKGAGPLILHRMSPDGLKVLDEGIEIVHDPKNLPTLEGPKLYKRNGYYYIFAPFGGVSTGSQAVLRSKSIYGPYEHRVVLARGSTDINGPHQGGYIETPDGKGWFIHFQSRGAHGRILHLEPVVWHDDWPVIGKAADGEQMGEPVKSWAMPVLAKTATSRLEVRPQTSDEFSSNTLGQQWEWNHNPDTSRFSLRERPGFLRLYLTQAQNLLTAHNTLTQQMQDNNLEFTIRLDLSHIHADAQVGLAMFEKTASGLRLSTHNQQRHIEYFYLDKVIAGDAIEHNLLDLRATVQGDTVSYSYSIDQGKSFQNLGPKTPITFSWWKGARPSVFAYSTSQPGKDDYLDVDWVHYRTLLN